MRKNIISSTLILILVLVASGFSYAYSGPETVKNHFDDSSLVIVTQNATFFTPGDNVRISVSLNCRSQYTMDEVKINGANVIPDKNGFASMMMMSGSLGTHEIPVQVSLSGKDGTSHVYVTSVKYDVGQPNTCMALEWGNILYIGVDNSIWISTAASFDLMTVQITGKEATLTKAKEGGHYIIRVKEPTDKCMVDVYANDKIVATAQYKVRYLPDPFVHVSGFKSGDSIHANVFKAAAGIQVGIKDFVFEHQRHKIMSYKLSIYGDKAEIRSASCVGAQFSDEAKELIKQYLEAGTLIVIEDIIVKDDAGPVSKLSPLVYDIK